MSFNLGRNWHSLTDIQVEYCEWTSTDKAELKTLREHPEEFCEKLFRGLEKMKSHAYIAANQHKVISHSNLNVHA